MLKLRENAIELLNSHNYFDNAIIFDKNAVAVYYDCLLYTSRCV